MYFKRRWKIRNLDLPTPYKFNNVDTHGSYAQYATPLSELYSADTRLSKSSSTDKRTLEVPTHVSIVSIFEFAFCGLKKGPWYSILHAPITKQNPHDIG
jgi:hypothetical protein